MSNEQTPLVPPLLLPLVVAESQEQTLNSTGFIGKDRRTLGSLIIIGIVVIVSGVLAVLASVLYVPLSQDTDRIALLKEIATTLQPGTIIIAALSLLGGLGAGIGIKSKEGDR